MNFIFYALLFILFPFIAQSQIKLEKITPELSNLWGVSVLNKEEVLFTQRAGKLFRLNVFKKKYMKLKVLLKYLIMVKEDYSTLQSKKIIIKKLFIYVLVKLLKTLNLQRQLTAMNFRMTN